MAFVGHSVIHVPQAKQSGITLSASRIASMTSDGQLEAQSLQAVQRS
jgi:hypothetical protein